MSNKIILLGLILFLSIASVSAITASIGNSRMILRPEVGEVVEKYILVKNINEVSVAIEVFASGDLAEDVEVIDDKFTLAPGEEKRAYFTIQAKKAGSTETKMNVQFTPSEGQGVGLASTVVVITSGGENSFEPIADETEESDFSFNPNPNNVLETDKGLSVPQILAISTAALIILFIVLIIYSTKVKRKKSVGRRNE